MEKHIVSVVRMNIDLIRMIIKEYDFVQKNKTSSTELIINDRLGHDYRYAIDISKINNELGWKPKTKMNEGLKNTLNWYLND